MKLFIILLSLFISNNTFSSNTYEYKSIKSISSTKVATCMIEEEKGILCWKTDDIHKLYKYKTFLKKPEMISVGYNNFCAIDREKVDCQVITNNDIFATNTYLTLVPQGIDKPRSISVSDNLACALDQKGIICWGTPPSRHIISRWRLNKSFSYDTKIYLRGNEVCTLDYNKVRCWKVRGTQKEFFNFTSPNKIIEFTYLSIRDGSYCVIDELYNLECFNRGAKINSFSEQENFPSKVKKASLYGNYLCTVDLDNHPQCWTRYRYVFNPRGRNPFNDTGLHAESSFSNIDYFTWTFTHPEDSNKYGAYGCIKDETRLVCEYKRSNKLEHKLLIFEKKGVINTEIISVGLRAKLFSTLIEVSAPLKSKFLTSLKKEIEEDFLSENVYSEEEKKVLLTLLSPFILDQNQSTIYRDLVIPEFNTLLSEYSNEQKVIKKSIVRTRLILAFIKSGIETSMYFLSDLNVNKLLSLQSYLLKALSSPSRDNLLISLNEYDKVYSILRELNKSSKSNFLLEILELSVDLIRKDMIK
jgi:hypothetical protein